MIRYLVVDYRTEEIEVGLPVEDSGNLQLGPDFCPGVLPAGEYLVTIHEGPYDGLARTTAALLESAREGELVLWSDEPQAGLTRWRGRVEHYVVGPDRTPEPKDWKTEVAILLRSSRGVTV